MPGRDTVRHLSLTLQKQLRDGVLPAGQRINESTLSRALGVSRTPLREALNRLTGAGLLHHREGFYPIRPCEDQVELLHAQRCRLIATALQQGQTDGRLDRLADIIRFSENCASVWCAPQTHLRVQAANRLILRLCALSENSALTAQIHHLNARLWWADIASAPPPDETKLALARLLVRFACRRPVFHNFAPGEDLHVKE